MLSKHPIAYLDGLAGSNSSVSVGGVSILGVEKGLSTGDLGAFTLSKGLSNKMSTVSNGVPFEILFTESAWFVRL